MLFLNPTNLISGNDTFAYKSPNNRTIMSGDRFYEG